MIPDSDYPITGSSPLESRARPENISEHRIVRIGPVIEELENTSPDHVLEPALEEPADFLHSSLREKLLEHIFIAEILKSLWHRGRRDVEVLRAEVDRGGCDMVVDCGNVCLHIQLKAMRAGSSTASVDLNTALLSKPSGCVAGSSSIRLP